MAAFKHTTTFVLQQTANASKPTALRCFVRYNNERSVFSSGEAIEPRLWNKQKQEPRQGAAIVNSKLKSRLKDIKNWIDIAFNHLTAQYSRYPTPNELKDLCTIVIRNDGLLPGTKAKAGVNQFTSYIDSIYNDTVSGKRTKGNGERYAPGTVKHYKSASGILESYAIHKGKTGFDFSDITLDFYYDFKEYCYQTKSLSDNYFGTIIKFIKTCMNESAEEGLHANTEHRSKRFIKVAVDVDNVYLNADILEQFATFDLSKNARLERARDLFLVGCWTGLRFSDFNNIKPNNIVNGFIEIKTQKTGETVVIPIHQNVTDIMKRYEGKTANSLPPSMSNVNLNLYVKEAAKEAKLTEVVSIDKTKAGLSYSLTKPLHELISTHTARRSFASNMFRMAVPTIVIMAITGHKTEKAFLKYIKVTPREKAVIMKEIWQRQTMKAVK